MDIDEEELREMFDHFDRDNNNKIDRQEFGELLDALGAGMSDDEVGVGFDVIDSNHNSAIEYSEFREWWGGQG
jgi:Ca2+-binding EF-hand superfamily protein